MLEADFINIPNLMVGYLPYSQITFFPYSTVSKYFDVFVTLKVSLFIFRIYTLDNLESSNTLSHSKP